MTLLLTLAALVAPPDPSDVGPLVRALWAVQRHGTPEARATANDRRVKGVLARALARDGVITFPELGGFMAAETFRELAGDDATLDATEVRRAVETTAPSSRARLLPRLREQADYLTTTFDLIDETHRPAGEALARWIAANYRPGRELHVSCICTGNSRRSILGAMMGSLAAAYYGLPEVRFHSGGTAPTAFNTRTITALEAIGFRVEATGREAPRGEPQTPNPIYRVSWGEGFDMLEFSKRYDDPANPREGFAALMVCGEADEACPFVKGAAARISTPYLDPKIYDGSAYEATKYAERRDDMGRLMLAAMMQARALIASQPAVRP